MVSLGRFLPCYDLPKAGQASSLRSLGLHLVKVECTVEKGGCADCNELLKDMPPSMRQIIAGRMTEARARARRVDMNDPEYQQALAEVEAMLKKAQEGEE